jgi:EF hand domain-containing protein
MRSKIFMTGVVACALTVPMAFIQTGCSSSGTAPGKDAGALSSARSDLGPVPGLSPEAFRRFDKNGDGFIERDEAEGPIADYFDDLDKDHDGKLSPAEVGTNPAVSLRP